MQQPRLPALAWLALALALPASPAYAQQLDARAKLALGLQAGPVLQLAPGAVAAPPDTVRLIVEGRAQDLDLIRRQPAFSPVELGGLSALAVSFNRDSLDALPPAVRVRAPLQYRPLLDVAMPALGLTPAARTQVGGGRGVVVAVVDTGLDVTHPDFALPGGGTRIVRYWDQTVDGPRFDAQLGYGVECNTYMILHALCKYDPEDSSRTGVAGFGHGTHVAGIAAGADDTYRGAAPEALVVGVRTFFNEIDLILGLAYVYRLHEQWGMPFVVNLSLGTNEGPHDGTSLLEKWIESHVGPGFVVVAAAGNETVADAQTGIHARFKGQRPAPAVGQATRLKMGTFATTVEQSHVEVYADGVHTDDLGFVLFDSSSSTVKGTPQRFTPVQLDAGVSVDLSSRVELHVARDYQSVTDRTGYAIAISAITGNLSDYELGIISYGDQALDAWVVDRSGVFTRRSGLYAVGDLGSLYFYSGDSSATVTNPGSSDAVLTVGSWVGRTRWPTVDGPYEANNSEVGDLGATSSHGPTRDGRPKPDLIAPGQFVVSSWSSWQEFVAIPPEVNDTHMVLYGTSMASPMLAGSAALLLEHNPQLSAAQIKALLIGSASAQPLTVASESLPDTRHGHGSPNLATLFASRDWAVDARLDTQAPVIEVARARMAEDAVASLDVLTDEPATLALVWVDADGGERSTQVPSYDTVHTVAAADGEWEKIRITATDTRGNQSAAYTVHVDGAGCGCAVTQTPAPHAQMTALAALTLMLAAGLYLRRQA